ncbi:metastasis-associated protein MTA1, partial [Clonorchis sinensis]
GQPVICKDQLEEWSTSESHLFEEALDKYSKVFPDILSDYMPWKTHKSLVEMYYFWKTTDRYVRQRRTKLAAQEHKLKQVYIPNYSKPNPSVLYNGPDKGGRGCEGCPATTSPQWYAWGPQNLLYRLCTSCWTYWKRYGGLKNLVSKERQAASRTSSQTSGSTSETDSKSMVITDGPVGSTASVSHCSLSFCACPMKSPSIPYFAFLILQTSVPSQSAMRYAEGGGVPAALVSGPRGTLCFRTPSVIRLARVLCPELVRPILLARRPGKPAETTATGGSSSISGSGDAVADSLSFAALRTAVEPLLSRLPDPTVLLVRPRRIAPLDCVINNLAERKGIPLRRIDFSHALGSASQLNGPVLTAGKRLRSPSGGNELNGTGTSGTKREMGDLLNGTQPVQEDNTSTSPPPCKKQATTGATGGTRTDPSNGIIIVPDGPVEKESDLPDKAYHCCRQLHTPTYCGAPGYLFMNTGLSYIKKLYKDTERKVAGKRQSQ